jgi:hypothetical protein
VNDREHPDQEKVVGKGTTLMASIVLEQAVEHSLLDRRDAIAGAQLP